MQTNNADQYVVCCAPLLKGKFAKVFTATFRS